VEPPESKATDFVGNRTECALLVMTRAWGQDYKALRDLNHEQTMGAAGGLPGEQKPGAGCC
jgi:Ca2+-transporting ATPase